MMDIHCRRHKNHQSCTQGGNEREHEKKKQKNGKNSGCSSGGSAWGMRAGDDAAGGRDTDIRADSDAGLCGGAVQCAETDECDKNAVVRTLPDNNAAKLTSVTAGNTVWGWGQTNTGWYFVQVGSQIGYVRYEAAAYAAQDQITAIQAQAATAAQQAAAVQAQAAQQAQIVAAAANQPAVAAGIVFIGDSRMVTLKDAVERNLGSCAAAVVAKNGSRHEWLHDTGIPQADKIIGKGSRVVINMGVNDLSDADKYAKDVNYWAAVWSARGAQIYYASVNPVWANSYGMTEERVKLFNDRLKGQLIPQIIWLDSHDYLMGVGVHASDGVHYKDDTNLVLYQYYLSMIGAV